MYVERSTCISIVRSTILGVVVNNLWSTHRLAQAYIWYVRVYIMYM